MVPFWLPENVLLVTVNEPSLELALEMAPPAPEGKMAWLSENVQLVTINVPPLEMAPPGPALLPLARVKSCSLRVLPEGTSISCTRPPPLIVMPGEPVGPTIVSLPAVTFRVAAILMVPVTWKIILLAPFRATQFLTLPPAL